jgi:hypothetical protein
MRFSTRTTIAAVTASIVLSACGGHGIVPSQSGVMPNSFEEMAKKANPCYTKAVQPTWIFKGNCVITKLPAKGATIKLPPKGTPPYMGLSLSLTLPANDGSNTPLVIVDAIGGKAKDIEKWSGKAFPLVKGKSVVYVQAVNGKKGLAFKSGFFVLAATSKKSLPGTSCPLSILNSKFAWTSTVTGSVKGKTVTYTIPASDLKIFFPDGLPKGPIFFNVSC